MEIGNTLDIGQLCVMVAIMWKLFFRSSDKQDSDHDKLILVCAKVEELQRDLNQAHAKIRALEGKTK